MINKIPALQGTQVYSDNSRNPVIAFKDNEALAQSMMLNLSRSLLENILDSLFRVDQ